MKTVYKNKNANIAKEENMQRIEVDGRKTSLNLHVKLSK